MVSVKTVNFNQQAESTGESGWVLCWPSSGLLRAGGNFEIYMQAQH